MGPYLAIVSASARILLQYRAAAFAGIVTQLFFGFVMVQAYTAFYAAATQPPPMALAEVVGYIWLGQAMLGLFPWNVDPEIRAQIRTGGVVYELLRPVDLYSLWFARAVARRTAPTLLRAVPMFIIAAALLGLPPPPSPEAFLAWIASTFCALVLSAAITTLLSITLMWTLSGDGAMMLVVSVVVFFSGQAVPLPMFPEWLQPLITSLPFRGLIDIPFRLYLGHIPAAEAPSLLAFQLAWAAALILFGRALMAHGRRVLVAQGG
ncbi:MAG: ABC-2 family transporter protein [Candidatus Latescibacteria bacterium]|nr:ABC-2 family transporter protein [Candidatus Latescibacterota bacterium]MDP7447321.1 ABC-2 family transporter protein [Candidatus Latescibacterota bacterium]HJP29408.1 ABC-2 family transporter protein [Candidatus Latescibacterota bacterium]